MAQYMLLLHEKPTEFANLGPEESQAVIAEYVAWGEISPPKESSSRVRS